MTNLKLLIYIRELEGTETATHEAFTALLVRGQQLGVFKDAHELARAFDISGGTARRYLAGLSSPHPSIMRFMFASLREVAYQQLLHPT